MVFPTGNIGSMNPISRRPKVGDAGKNPSTPYGSLWTHQSYSLLCLWLIFIHKITFLLIFIIYLIIYVIIYFIIFYDAITSTYILIFYCMYREFTALPPLGLFLFPLLVHLSFL